MLRIYARVLAVVLALIGITVLVRIPGVGLGVGIFHLCSAATSAYAGLARRGAAIIRGVVGGIGVLLLLSGLLVALTMSFLGFPFGGRGWEAGLAQAALGGLTMACAVLLPCDDGPTIS